VTVLRRAYVLVANVVKLFERSKKVSVFVQNLLPRLVSFFSEESVFEQRHNFVFLVFKRHLTGTGSALHSR
jgi:hypothetical protein